MEENREFIKETRARGNRPRIIEQEPKSEVKLETVKEENITLKEEDKPINPEDFEAKFEAVAAGFVCDELPPQLI